MTFTRQRGTLPKSTALIAVTVTGVLLCALLLPAAANASPTVGWGTGFVSPFSGPQRFERLAPTELTDSSQLNQPLGQHAADVLAVQLGLSRADSFTPKQYAEFISGKGAGGQPGSAALVDLSVQILTNTVGRPLYSRVNGQRTASVLASYGLFVNKVGMLESPANSASPARRVNNVIEPTGYLTRWCIANDATKSLAALYGSAYPLEAAYGFAAQTQTGPAQLVTNTKAGTSVEVGMSMAPALWLTNFLLIYTLNPRLAAEMPAHWAPIPAAVAAAMQARPTGRVPYSEYAALLS